MQRTIERAIDKPNPLIEVAQQGDFKSMQALIASGVDVNRADNENKTALMWAIRSPESMQQQNMQAFLIAAGADVNSADNTGKTPLMWAVLRGNAESMQALIAAGSELNKADNEGETALMWAIRSPESMQQNIQALIAAGADVNKADNTGITPLMLAAGLRGNAESMQALIAAGADVNKANNTGIIPLMCAVLRGNAESIQALIASGSELNKADNTRKTPLMCAVLRGNTESMQALIAAGADVNRADNTGKTPLMCAVLRGNAESIQALIAAGADVNRADNEGETALIWAGLRGNTESMQALIAAGADVNRADNKGKTALMRASNVGNTEIVDTLHQQRIQVFLEQLELSKQAFTSPEGLPNNPYIPDMILRLQSVFILQAMAFIQSNQKKSHLLTNELVYDNILATFFKSCLNDSKCLVPGLSLTAVLADHVLPMSELGKLVDHLWKYVTQQRSHKKAQHDPETQETQTVDRILTDFFDQFATQKRSRTLASDASASFHKSV